MRIYLGSYDSGIAILEDRGSVRTAAPSEAPSFLAAHPALPVLYAVREAAGGAVEAFTVTGDGTLTPLGSPVSTGGDSPCHLAVSADGRRLAVANYGSGNLGLLALGTDGRLGELTDLVQHAGHGPHPDRQTGPHCHQTTFGDDGLTAVDLGVDALYHYHVAEDGSLTQVGVTRTTPGAGPRHVVTHASGRRYVTDELASTVSTYEPGPSGWTLVGSVPATLTPPAGDNLPSELALSPDGTLLHVANRGNNTIATFSVVDNGLSPVDEVPTGGDWPRHFVRVHDALYVANQNSGSITALELDDRGRPQPGTVIAELATPTMILPLP